MHANHEMPSDWKVRVLRFYAERLIHTAKQLGFTVTIETAPRLPLAMGNHNMKVEIRSREYRQ